MRRSAPVGWSRDLWEGGLDVIGGDGPGSVERCGEQRVMGEEVDFAREPAGGLEDEYQCSMKKTDR